MPQISPMQWFLIILLFLAVLLSVKSSFPLLIENSSKKFTFLKPSKPMKW